MRRKGNERSPRVLHQKRAAKVEEESLETARLGGPSAARALKAVVAPGRLRGRNPKHGKPCTELPDGSSGWQTE